MEKEENIWETEDERQALTLLKNIYRERLLHIEERLKEMKK